MTTQTIRVLLIDDDERDYLLTRQLFSQVKTVRYELSWAASYEEGLRVAGLGEHHVCLVDYRLGDHSGVELIRAARESRLSTPMILLTGHGDHDVDVKAMEAGATDYLMKHETSPARLERTVRYAAQLNAERCLAEASAWAYARKQTVIAEIGRIALTGGDLQNLFGKTVTLVAGTLGVEYCKVLELLPGGETFALQAGVGWKEESPIGQVISASEGYQPGFALTLDAPLVVEDLRKESRFTGPPLAYEAAVVSGISVVIRARKSPYGVLSAHAATLREFTPDEINFMTEVANVLAEAISRKRADEADLAQVLSLNIDIAHRQRVEEALRKSEERFQLVTRATKDPIWDWDLVTNDLWWNESFQRMFGYRADEVGSGIESWTGRLHPDDLGWVGDGIHEAIDSGQQSWAAEYRFRRADGSYALVADRGYVVHDDLGKPVRMLGSMMDVTERKRVEAALEKSAQRERAMIANALDLICTIDREGRFISVSPACFKLLGYQPEELIGRGFIEFVAPEDVVRTIKEDASIVSGTETTNFENRYVHRNGSLVHLVWTSYWSDSEQLVFAVAHDNTERHLTNEALRDKEAQLGEAQRISHIGSWEWNIAQDRITWSDELYRIFGLSPQEFDGTFERYQQCVHPEDLEYVGEKIESALKLPNSEYSHRIIRPDGTVRVVQANASTTLDESGSAIKMMGTAQDITEQRHLEEELKQARDTAIESVRLKSEFLANMSHEIRTPMNGVIGMTGLLLETALSNKQQEYTDSIQLSADALLIIIDDILDFSKIEAGLMRFEKIDFELRGAVEATVELLAERAQSKGLELASLVYQGVPTALRGDPGRLRQVLTNLMGNAVKFTEQGEVVISVTKIGETATEATLRFAIKDTGIGISPEAQRLLFRAFTQADGSTTRKYGGTGLGLAISKQLVALMGGEIGINSATGEGSTFWFTAKFEKQPMVSATTEKAILSGVRVLIVDDSPTNRNILKHETRSWGMTATEADSGKTALELLRAAAVRHESYDIVVLDLLMPEMDGFELAEAIKSDPAISSVALVLLPSSGRPGHGERAAQVGIAAYLPKPIRHRQLHDCLTAVVSTTNREIAAQQLLVTRHSLRESEIRVKNNGGSTLRIIIAEDNEVNQMVAVGQLENLGYVSRVVNNGLELLDAVEHDPVHIILMDCQMPEMDGFAATAEIRRREGRDRHTIIIAMTANAFDGDQEKCLAAGMDDYISKPVKAEVLGEKLQRWTTARRTEKGLADPKETLPLILDDILDRAQLATLRAIKMPQSTDFVTELIDTYLKLAPSSIKGLHEAVLRNDTDEIRQGAHSLKGSSASIGAIQMAALCAKLESKDDSNDSTYILAQLEQEFEKASNALRAERREPR